MPKLKKKRWVDITNEATLSVNALETVSLYGLYPFGSEGQDPEAAIIRDWSIVVTNPRHARKKGDEISR